jgi:hypothetical protein
MPQLVKGGKNVFGWSKVNKDGKIIIPPDAFIEYKFKDGEKVILMSGSNKSGGFGLTSLDLLKNSRIFSTISAYPDLIEYKLNEGEAIKVGSKIYCWVPVYKTSITVPFNTLQLYGIREGNSLLTVRGSNLALGFIVRGPIIEEAKRHSNLEIFE